MIVNARKRVGWAFIAVALAVTLIVSWSTAAQTTRGEANAPCNVRADCASACPESTYSGGYYCFVYGGDLDHLCIGEKATSSCDGVANGLLPLDGKGFQCWEGEAHTPCGTPW
eukprot:548787-Prymnesium_polylepis.1